MDNFMWYSRLIRFCKLNDSCLDCPYHLENDTMAGGILPCFSDKQHLDALSSWLARSSGYHNFPDGEEISKMISDITDKNDEEYLLEKMNHSGTEAEIRFTVLNERANKRTDK